MVKNRLAQADCRERGWLLDGYPRSESQAEALEQAGIKPDVFLLLEVPDSVLVERVVGRRLDPVTGKIYHLIFSPPPAEVAGRLTQRSDDTEEKARPRFLFWPLCGGKGCCPAYPARAGPLTCPGSVRPGADLAGPLRLGAGVPTHFGYFS